MKAPTSAARSATQLSWEGMNAVADLGPFDAGSAAGSTGGAKQGTFPGNECD
jgi:hypothetical protein